jgi:hypothetical protein
MSVLLDHHVRGASGVMRRDRFGGVFEACKRDLGGVLWRAFSGASVEIEGVIGRTSGRSPNARAW